ncbi:MAG: ABC transporter permease [Acidobacteriota bacterium]|nr:ABC transporter permease [Blastocatellia bacterium]MDW8239143.1 ABC transporter permease [Acidobacteriota bacterium]
MTIPLKYNIRSLLVRRTSTLMTVMSIALVVCIFVGIMALAQGLETALVTSGDPLNVLVRRQGSNAELSSSVPREAFRTLAYWPGVQSDAAGDPLAAAEIVTAVNLPKHNQQQGANITIRGVSANSMQLRRQMRLIEGRMFRPGLREVIVGRRVRERFQNTHLGDRLNFGKAQWQVVGIFEAGNTAFDSEIWADVNQLADDFNRQTYSSALLRATDAAAAQALIERINNDRRFNLMGQIESDYYAEQTQAASAIKGLALFIAFVMGIGACFAAMNTMYAAVAYRTREIATLQVLGFKPWSVLLSFMTESLLLSLIGGLIGCLLVLPVNGLTTGTVNWQTFSEVAFAFRITPNLLLTGMGFAALMGLLGGLWPARQASRQTPAAVLREA